MYNVICTIYVINLFLIIKKESSVFSHELQHGKEDFLLNMAL